MPEIFVNGEKADSLSALDRGLAYGDGLFETILIHDGCPQLLQQHLARLSLGLQRLSFDRKIMDQLQLDLDALKFAGEQCLKIIISRGIGQRGYAFDGSEQPSRILILDQVRDFSIQKRDGVQVCLCQHKLAIQPVLAGIKHLNRLDQVIARSEWQQEYAEGILLDLEGYVVEGTMSNVFWVAENGEIYTPSLENCGVQGIMRDHIIALLEDQGYTVNQGRYDLNQLQLATEIFLTNSLIETWPVTHFNGDTLVVGEITKLTQTLLAQEKNQ